MMVIMMMCSRRALLPTDHIFKQLYTMSSSEFRELSASVDAQISLDVDCGIHINISAKLVCDNSYILNILLTNVKALLILNLFSEHPISTESRKSVMLPCLLSAEKCSACFMWSDHGKPYWKSEKRILKLTYHLAIFIPYARIKMKLAYSAGLFRAEMCILWMCSFT